MFGRRPTARSTCDATTSGSPDVQSTDTATPSGRGLKLMHSASVRTVMPSLDENRPDGFRNVLVLTSDQARSLLDDRDVGAEAPVHLREFEPNVAAADDHEMLRYPVERKDRAVGEIGNFADARHLGHRGAAADVDEDASVR